MKLGIFAKTFQRPSLEQTLDAVQAYGLHYVQFNMACAGLPSMPEAVETDTARRIKLEAEKRNISIAAVSGTFNMIHPDRRIRSGGLDKLRNLAAVCGEMETSVITLCTGTRDPYDMWKPHPDNHSKEAWKDLIHSMQEALKIAEQFGVTLAFEPEPGNVVSDAQKGKLLLDAMGSSRLKVVMDAANLVRPGEPDKMPAIMEQAFELLGEHIVIAHAKDFTAEEETQYVAAGTGLLDYDRYVSLLKAYSFEGPLILHGLDESEVRKSVDFLRDKITKR